MNFGPEDPPEDDIVKDGDSLQDWEGMIDGDIDHSGDESGDGGGEEGDDG